ncbi:hypothetical protein BSKO_06895 [Bryopsis sp. KO-2023]|nr:hypothetical protein BSKO_06895 [Bryopsis sp. KO-2023]
MDETSVLGGFVDPIKPFSPKKVLRFEKQSLLVVVSETRALIAKQTALSFASGALLGPVCDGFHSSHDVLHYKDPVLIQLDWIGYSLETCWWVPVLFGVAGVILGVSHPLLDEWRAGKPNQQFARPSGGYDPNWALVLTCIGLFCLQYYLSGALESPLASQTVLGVHSLDLVLFVYAVHHFLVFDCTIQGLFMASATAVCGPLIEIMLINQFDLYEYSNPDFLGIPSWIPWVYFCGAPAVGNLGRKFWTDQLKECSGKTF